MYKPPGNAQAILLQKTCRDRSYNLSSLDVIKVEVPDQKKPNRICAWCALNKLSHGNQKYCSTECSDSAMAWAYPQKEHGLGMLLMRQDWKCNVCHYDYVPLVLELLRNGRVYDKPADFRIEFSWSLVKRLKNKVDSKRKPEVDHINPVSKGGQAIGLDNHQAICYQCHKEKTKKDNSGPRVVDPVMAEKRRKKRVLTEIYKKQSEYYSKLPTIPYNKEAYQKRLSEFHETLSKEELLVLRESFINTDMIPRIDDIISKK